MKPKKLFSSIIVLCLSILFFQCEKESILLDRDINSDEISSLAAAKKGDNGGKPGGEVAGNNLSFPVIWSEGVQKILQGNPGMNPFLQGEWWYTWGTNGTDPDITPASCPPDPDESDFELNPEGLSYCDDGIPRSLDEGLIAGVPEADNSLPLVKAYIQKDQNNVWQAESADWSLNPVDVHWIDWGDNLESVDWYTKSQVRTEVVLFQDLVDPMLEYEMRHTSGWGIDEVHGLAADLGDKPLEGPGDRATIYSHCARLTIQKLMVPADDPLIADLKWVPEEGWTELDPETNVINDPFFNDPVYEGGDGPGFYSAEINVKGRIIFGYTWNVRNDHDDSDGTVAGRYRITFSFDEVCGTTTVNTHFTEGITNIMVPLEVEVLAAVAAAEDDDSGDAGGAVPVLVTDKNLTYIDVNILERGGGGKGGGGGGGNGGGRK